MKNKRKGEDPSSPPKEFHPNSWCIAYSNGECDFFVNNIFTPTTERKIKAQAQIQAAFVQDPKIPIEYKISPSYYYRDQIARCQELTDTGLRYTDEAAKYVMKVVKEFGIDALRLNLSDQWRIHPLSQEEINERTAHFNEKVLSLIPKEPSETRDTSAARGIQLTKIQLKRMTNRKKRSPDDQEDSTAWMRDLENRPERLDPLDYLHPLARTHEEAELRELGWREGLGPVICEILRFWQDQVNQGSAKDRQQAIKHLKAFGKALIPEARGKRKNTRTASAYEVKKFYLKELYRFYHVQHAIRSSAGPKNSSLKVNQASQNYKLTIQSIREFLGLDKDNNPDRQPFTPKDMVRELTARKFKITHQTVSNLLSS